MAMSVEHGESWGDPASTIAWCTRWLVEHPDAPLTERVGMATVIACGGDIDGQCTFGDIALYLGTSPQEALQALLALREQSEAAFEEWRRG